MAQTKLVTQDANGAALAAAFKPSGLTGAVAAARFVGATASGAPTTGTFQVGDFIVDQTGGIWVCTAAGSPGSWVKGGGGSILASTSYNPASNTTVNLGTTEADVDAAHAVVTFTAPVSGVVIVRSSFLVIPAASTATGQSIYATYRSGAAAATGTRARILNTGNSGAGPIQVRVTHTARVTGLTAGQSYTYTLGAYYANGTGAASVGWGDDGSATPLGPLVMEVLSA